MAGSSGAAAAEPLWVPSEERRRAAVISRYLDWLERDRGLAFPSYDELWAWSVRDIEAFWQSVWDFFGIVAHQPPTAVLSEHRMPGARWFPGATLNYAEHALRR
ncbi:MAG TPA: acetyl-coenzyme A synthetase N-terminal domain-containing protein, partial [Kineosporiaceae bacterium]|nr:acetyl-coenzyme A synthetase N-terminal domain-containing protein [Kineosporiaceae bacterium]